MLGTWRFVAGFWFRGGVDSDVEFDAGLCFRFLGLDWGGDRRVGEFTGLSWQEARMTLKGFGAEIGVLSEGSSE